MKFPGDNELSLSEEAVNQMLAAQINTALGSDVRVTAFKLSTYGSVLKVNFTSDPDQLPVPVPVPVPVPALTGAASDLSDAPKLNLKPVTRTSGYSVTSEDPF